jgi:hypothetical protein
LINNQDNTKEASRTPFFVGAAVFAGAGVAAYMASSGSSQGSSIIAARREKVYDHEEPWGYDQYQAECTADHQDMIARSIAAVKPII